MKLSPRSLARSLANYANSAIYQSLDSSSSIIKMEQPTGAVFHFT
jgi:hypothetical protein